MRLLVHDFGGYPFPLPMSRALAARGHTVRHVYCGSLATTPNDALPRCPDDPATLSIERIDLGEPLAKYDFVKRWRQERRYGRLVARATDAFAPDVVLSGNTPLDAQRPLLRTCRRRGIRFVFWVQDLLGVAAHRLLRAKIPVVGDAVGRYYTALERRLLRRSDAVVCITEDFVPLLTRYGVDPARLHVVENWAVREDTPPRPKANAWARRHALADAFCFLYSGTLGMKHNPALLLALADRFRDRPEVRVVVVSEGLGAEWLRERPRENLVLLPFQPYDALPGVLGTADVLTAVLEPDAGVFSVPSKVLTYLCAERPLLLAVPPENLAARIVQREAAGLLAAPTDADAFLAAAERLYAEADLRRRLAANARRYAERAFDLDAITDRFEQILNAAR
ncbi:MAG: glycosyltransferase family 4 protein [Rhodothermales bacterium]|nr:glycosyltransferase family 4 protein [Rhodothermales bacterium]